MPSNDVIAKIVLCDLDLISEGKKFETLISLKKFKLVQNAWDGFRLLLCLPSNGVVRKLYSVTLTHFFKLKNWDVNIYETMRSNAILIERLL